MKIRKKLLSFRYSKNFFINKIRASRLKSHFKYVNLSNHNSCPICGCSSGVLISEVDRVGFQCDTVVCDGCDLVFNNSYIANAAEFYSRSWGDDRWGDPEENFVKRTTSDSYSWKRMAYVAKAIGSKFKNIESVLEIGCGDGCNLLPYHLVGKEVTGFDFDDRYLSPGLSRGMNLIQGGLKDMHAAGTYDLAMLIHSFEHMLDLDSAVTEVSSRLPIGGYVYIEVPGVINWNQPVSNTQQAMGMRSSCNFLNYLQFQHNYHFDLNHLKHIWERHGFEMVAGDEWVRCVFLKATGIDKKDRDVIPASEKKIFNHLQGVESEFFSLKNFSSSLARYWSKI